ncbi:serine/threonine protein kinase [Gigaspora margarita]|uniref:Serine/threonine protein kinase n=1 Tax=Gigaspora margarita TaxID=4874 RepID=A0A8H4AG40_GIGMA|nr:serine/threonine protein kinase [Gigaspora margarita]
MVHAQSYDYDSLKYKLLSFLHSKEDPIKEDSYESSGFELVESDYGVCSDCSRPNTSTDWCHMCNAERFRQGFGWNHEMQQWQRYQFMYDDKCRFLTTLDNMYSGTFGISIALKCLHDSSNVDEEFLNEWKTHLKCYKVVRGTRPKTVEGTPESYAKLMMKCWDLNPLRRPTALELKETLGIWKKKCGYYYFDEEERKTWGDYDDDNDNYDDYEIRKATLEFIKADKDLERFQNFDKQIFTRHSKACYTSRLISFPGINILPNPQDYSASITALTLDDTIEESEKDHYTL